MDMKLIEVRNLYKTYKRGKIQTPALNGIELTINKGDFVSIAGPSGSGKTTLLNIIGALDKPTSGTVLYDKTDITSINIHRLSDFRLRKIGFIFQAYNLIPTLTALENAEYVMLLQGIDKNKRLNKAKEILGKLGLKDCLYKRPGELSGGQQQRVAVARAIVSEPEVILADEPTANLDSANASSLIDSMYELNREKEITFIFSTHDKMVMEKAHKVFLLRDGKLINDP